jgi:hypothetical protein
MRNRYVTIAWTLLSQIRLNGRFPQRTLSRSLVRRAISPVPQRNGSGSTVDRLSSPRITVKSGKNFTNVNVVNLGGVGAAIAPPPS